MSYALVSLVVSVSTAAHSALVVSGTRVIYPSDQKVVTVQVKNEGAEPALMQTWVDDGDANITPENSQVPFVITPPVSRLDAKTGQMIQITYIDAQLPQDRESVFWLNVLDIPAKPKATTDKQEPNNFLQIAIRNRIKLFYRPITLAGKAIEAPKQLQWQVSQNNLTIKNPTPYYVNISSLKPMNSQGAAGEFAPEGLMLEPFQTQSIKLNSVVPKKLQMLSINDYGGMNSHEIEIKP